MRILINTMADDVHAECVGNVLRERGHIVEEIRNADYPMDMRLSFEVAPRIALDAATQTASMRGLETVDAVWHRRNTPPTMPTDLADADRAFVRQELHAARLGFWALAGRDAFWINADDAANRAMHKPLQLEIAARLGMRVPETLISNDPARVRDFVRRHRGDCVYKPFHVADWKENGDWVVAFTSMVDADDLPSDRLLQACPGIYQRRVRKQAEIRATFMGESCLAVRIDSQATAHGKLDWRVAQNVERLASAPVELPADVRERCIALMRALGIVFGCFDFIVAEDGGYVFLEVNEAGQFLFLETWCPELPALDMFCDFIVSRDARFRYRAPARPVRCVDYAALVG